MADMDKKVIVFGIVATVACALLYGLTHTQRLKTEPEDERKMQIPL